MTDSKTYNVQGASVITTVTVYPHTLKIDITVDLSPLDQDEPSHGPHRLYNYFQLPRYKTGQTYWWCKFHFSVCVKSGSQARRVIKHALDKIDDAVFQAKLDRDARKAQLQNVLP